MALRRGSSCQLSIARVGQWGGGGVPLSHLSDLGRGFRQLRVFVDVLEGDRQPLGLTERDQLPRHRRRHRLPVFVVPDVSLSATDAIGYDPLGDAEPLSDDSEVCIAPSSASMWIAQYRQ